MLIGIVTDSVEDEELRLRTKVGGVGNAGGLEVGLCLLRDVSRISIVIGAGDGVGDIADQTQRRILCEGIHYRGVAIRHHQHVARLDRHPSANRGAVDAEAFFKRRLILELRDGNRKMLPTAEQVDELDIDHDGALLFHQR